MPKRKLPETTGDSEVESEPRQQLASCSTLDDVVEQLHRAKNVVVLCGAGISVSCGIPDFRSANGIYSLVQELDLGLDDPQMLFDLETFREDPSPFYTFAHRLYPQGVQPSRTHRFLAQLERRKKLRRVYTQNIDGLELSAGVSSSKFISCHGSLATVTCTGCKKQFAVDAGTPPSSSSSPPSSSPSSSSTPSSSFQAAVAAGRVARCQHCNAVLRPDVTFFGEPLRSSVKRALESDRSKADFLLVVGTSLQVQPMSHVVGFLPPSVPQVLLNLTPVAPLPHLSAGFDVCLLGPCDDAVAYLESKLGWALYHEDTISPALLGDNVKSNASAGNSNVISNGNDSSSDTPAIGASDNAAVTTTVASPPSSTSMPLSGNVPAATEAVAKDDDLPSPPTPAGERIWRFGTSEAGDSSDQSRGCLERSSSSGSIEVVSCDECGNALTTGFSCLSCFDYDLCAKCHKSGKSKHARKTGHRFKTF